MKHLTSKEYTGKGSVAKVQASKAEEAGDRILRFVISTSGVDRDGDVLNQNGWDLSDYLNNPVVLFAHNSDEAPIGKCISIGVVNNELVASVQFVPADNPYNGDKAEGIYQMCRDGFISGVSVGYLPTEWAYSDEREGAKDFNKQSLLEFSICSVPCNPECLIIPDAKSMTISTDIDKQEDQTKSINKNVSDKHAKKMLAEALLLLTAI